MLLNETKGKVITCSHCDGTTWINGKHFEIFGGTGKDIPCQWCDEDGKRYYSEYTDIYRFYKDTEDYKILSNEEIRNYKNKFPTDKLCNEYIDVEIHSMISQEFINELIEKFPEYKLGIEEALEGRAPNFLKSIRSYEDNAIYDEEIQTLYYENDYYSGYTIKDEDGQLKWEGFDITKSPYINMSYIRITFPDYQGIGKKHINTIINYLSEIKEERKKIIYEYLAQFAYDMKHDDLDREYYNRKDEEPYDHRFIKKNLKDCCLNQDLRKFNNFRRYILKDTNFVPEIGGRRKS